MNAREDQLIDNYGIDIYKMARKEGKSWVVGSNQIAYLKPAFLMEDIIIQFNYFTLDSHLLLELRMLNSDKTEIKAIMWSTFVHFNLLQKKREKHSEEFIELFKKVVNSLAEPSFEQRISAVKKHKM